MIIARIITVINNINNNNNNNNNNDNNNNNKGILKNPFEMDFFILNGKL